MNKDYFIFLGLTLLSLPTFTVGAPSSLAQEATQAGFDTKPIDVKAIIKDAQKNPEQYLNQFGADSFNGLTAGVVENSNLYQKGMGDITTPAQFTVDDCQDKTDPTCRAIQLMRYERDHRPEPEAPEVRAVAEFEAYKEALPAEKTPGNVPCQPIMANFEPAKTEVTCRPGTLLERIECFQGVEPDGTVLVSKVRIPSQEPITLDKTCEPKKIEHTETKKAVTCREPQVVNQSRHEDVDAKVTYQDYWDYACRPRRYKTTRVTCSRYRAENDDKKTCPNGTVRTKTHTIDELLRDSIPQFDTLTATYICGKGLILSINGASTVWDRGEGSKSRLLRDRNNRKIGYMFHANQKDCTGNHCVFRYSVELYRRSMPTVMFQGMMVIDGEGEPAQPPQWIDNCKALREGAAK